MTSRESVRTIADKRGIQPVRQLRIVITPWASGHCTVDIIRRDHLGAEHWDRRTGHLDLDIHPRDLSGLTTVELLRLIARAADA